MASKPLFMETTAIEALKTASEIQAFLVQAGANRLMLTYDKGDLIGLHFVLNVSGRDVPFELPVRIDPIFKILNGRRRYDRLAMTVRDREQAKRVAWRRLYRWTQAQLAMIETGMVAADEVFMPYMQVGANETLYQRAVTGGFRALLPEGRANGE